jgi:hypothetical protein
MKILKERFLVLFICHFRVFASQGLAIAAKDNAGWNAALFLFPMSLTFDDQGCILWHKGHASCDEIPWDVMPCWCYPLLEEQSTGSRARDRIYETLRPKMLFMKLFKLSRIFS